MTTACPPNPSPVRVAPHDARLRLELIAAAGLVLCAIAAAVTLTGLTPTNQVFAAAGLGAGLVMGLGLRHRYVGNAPRDAESRVRAAGEVESSSRELRESRARILASADGERRRIERDLHDGAQQRLVALRIQLELVEELMESDPQRGMQKLHALGGEVGTTLDEIMALARGIYPSLLADRGLAEALRAAALRTPISASVEPRGVARYPQDVESAVYFCCLEALQNASKHARGAHAITISLRQDHALRFQVRDDGAGFDSAATTPGAGLTNMRDRLVAVGGELSIRSSSGGTVVTGSVPLRGNGGNGATPALGISVP